jgi:hypothetical protein
MKRLALIVVVVIPAFASGVVFKGGWQRFTTLPYCEVARNAQHFHGKMIRAKSTLIFGSDGMYVFEDCDPVSALASLVEFEGARTSRITRSYTEEVLVSDSQDKIQKVDAVITGRFDAEFSRSCWAPAFRIAATEIEFVSPVTEFKPPASESGLRTRH